MIAGFLIISFTLYKVSLPSHSHMSAKANLNKKSDLKIPKGWVEREPDGEVGMTGLEEGKETRSALASFLLVH